MIKSDKKMAIMITAIMVISAFALVTPASANCCIDVDACNLTQLLGTVGLGDCWDDYIGDENFELMMIDNKTEEWVPVDGCPYGLVGYYNYTEENRLKGAVEVWGLTPNANHQITLNGPGGCTAVDSALASGFYGTPTGVAPPAGFNFFERGYWDGSGPYLIGNCQWAGEGIWNFGMNVTTDDCGHFCYEFNLTLPCGKYEGVKFLVKECTADECYEPVPGQWVPKLMECDPMDFSICPSGEATDPTGLTQEVYTTAETVYATGSGFDNNSLVDIYIVNDYKWVGGENILGYTIYAQALNVPTDATGNIIGEEMWPNPIPGEYDMVFDANQNGIYDVGVDAVDHPNHPGFTVVGQVPGLTPIGLIALVGLLAIIATSTIVRIRKRR